MWSFDERQIRRSWAVSASAFLILLFKRQENQPDTDLELKKPQHAGKIGSPLEKQHMRFDELPKFCCFALFFVVAESRGFELPSSDYGCNRGRQGRHWKNRTEESLNRFEPLMMCFFLAFYMTSLGLEPKTTTEKAFGDKAAK